SLPWSGQFAADTSVTLEAVPDSSWQFDNWSGDVSWTGSTLIVTMDASKSITANFSQIQYTLGLTGTGSGSVRVDGILRSLPWSGQFIVGSSVTLEAVPDAGWQFDNWSGDVSWSGSTLIVTMDASKSLTANFTEVATYTLSLGGTGSGSARVDGTLRSLPWSGQFAADTSVTLEAVPDAGWQFDNWSGDVSWSGSTLVVTMDASKSITANFTEAPTYTLSLGKTGSGSVTVDGTPRALPWSGPFTPGAMVILEAVPDPGCEFEGWSGDASWSGSTLVVTMDANKSITANFSEGAGLTLTVSQTGAGSVEVDGTTVSVPWSGQFDPGSTVTVEALPEVGWEFAGWSGDASGSSNPLTVMMDADKSITANFSDVVYTLSLDGTGSGSVVVEGVPHSLPWSGEFASGSS
ncbi:MAG: hypothetical protein KAX80_09610, partial [Planctomycetes bacterium]|nr:hypothetical protein [Planctomycetota bacterium]